MVTFAKRCDLLINQRSHILCCRHSLISDQYVDRASDSSRKRALDAKAANMSSSTKEQRKGHVQYGGASSLRPLRKRRGPLRAFCAVDTETPLGDLVSFAPGFRLHSVWPLTAGDLLWKSADDSEATSVSERSTRSDFSRGGDGPA